MSAIDTLIAKAIAMPIFPLATNDSADGKRRQHVAALLLYAALVALALWLIRAFIPSIVWALVIAILVWPVLQRVSAPRQSHLRATVIALALTTVVGLFIVLPIVGIFAQLAHETHHLMNWFSDIEQNGIAMPDFVQQLPFGKQLSEWWQANLARPLQESPAMQQLRNSHVATAGRHFGTLAVRGIVHFGFMLITLFVVLRTGPQMSEHLVKIVRRVFGADGAHLATRMTSAVRGTVTGLVVVGLGEGALIGVAYFAAGMPNAAELGLVTAIAAMVPFCAPIVFCIAGLWLVAHGMVVGAVAVVVIGFVVVFVAEHFVRPSLIGGATRLPFLLVLFGILGGAETFGLVGLFIGPALMTVLIVLWHEALR
jgi:predicted PurR-regulated permease PerM